MDNRTKVRHLATRRIGAIEKVISGNYCSVQFKGDRYYEVCAIDDLEPVSEEEYGRGKRL